MNYLIIFFCTIYVTITHGAEHIQKRGINIHSFGGGGFGGDSGSFSGGFGSTDDHEASFSSSSGLYGDLMGDSFNERGRETIDHHVPVQINTHVTHVDVPQPVEIPIYKKVPYPVPQKYYVPVPKPYKVPYAVHVPYTVIKKVPVQVEKPYPVKVPVKVPVTIPKPYEVSIEKPYPVHIPVKIPQHIPYPVTITKPVYIKKEHDGGDNYGNEESSYSNSQHY